MSGSSQKPVSGAGGSGSQGSGIVPIPSIEEKNKKIQQETLMEKLRAKYRAKPKSYEDIKKSVRMYFIEKHYPMDPVHKATLQTALDKLQNYIKVTSRHGLVERLESLSRQLGLKFMEDQQTLFISTDMFYVEILLDTSGNLNDVKVHHECKIEQQASTSSSSSSSSPELLNCLKAGDFADFTVQLEGLSSIYQLNAEPKVKKKAFVALQAMETDIYNLYQHQLQLQQRTNESSNSYHIMNNSLVGLVLPRRGGHPMKLTYFCPPLHLVEANIKGEQGVAGSSGGESRDFNIDQVIKSPQGLSATLNLEGSSANKLQILPTISFTSEDGSALDMPIYMPLTQNNSMLMPATYVLRLNKPMPVCIESLRALGLPGLPAIEPGEAGTRTVMNLIVETASRQAIRNTQKGLYVNLLKETHCYFLTDNRRLQGTMISSLPFTEPAQVTKIIAFLKKQSLFCTLLSSCVREQQKHYNDMESTIILEVTAVSLNQITVELQHPYEESLATVDFLLDGDGDGQPSCIIYCLNYDYEALSQKLTRTVRQVFSIPMVIYKLLRCWDEDHQQKMHGVMPSPSSGSSGGNTGGFGSSRGGVGGSSTAVGGSSNFGQFALDAGAGDGTSGVGGGGGFTSVSNMKFDNKVRALADAFAASTSAAAAIAGLMNLKRETDPQASSSSSPNPLPTSSSPASSSKDQEIADKYKNIWKDKTPNLKHSVSITPIAGDGMSPLQQQQQQVDMQRTGGIEIIPLNAPATVTSGATPGAGSPATTITITPITGASKEAAKESKKSANSGSGSKRSHDTSILSSSSSSNSSNSSSGSNSSNETQKEKKRKKKRDDSPMGPPEKIYSRQNSPGMTADGASGSGVVRKFSTPAASSSPKAGSSATGASLGLGLAGQSSARPSPKHSPVYSSPKHSSNSNTASNSPKSPFGTHSPKHGSSGKPSMSTLKSATAATSLSLSPKAEKSSTGSSGSGSLPLPLGGLPLGLTSTGSSSVSGAASGSNPPMLRPVPPLASSSQLPLSIKKEKPSSSSNVTATASHPSGVVAAAVGALKSSQQQQQQQQQQQMKSTVASLSHLAAGGSLGSYAAPAVSALELNALRKGLAGTGSGVGPGPGMGVGSAAGAVGAVSLMMSTPASTTTSAAAASTTTTVPALVASSTTAITTSVAETGTTVGITTQQQQQQAAAPLSIYSSVSSSSSSSSGIGGASHVAGSSGPSSGPSTEYMVKPSSQEGLKLTINKTGNNSSKRESKGGPTSSSASSSSSSSKKQHTGLKPGVNSGPACKKAGSGGSSSSSKHVFQKANSSGNLSSKLSGSSGSGLTLTKSNSTNSFQEQQGVPKRRPSLTNTGLQRKTPSTSHGSASGSGGGTGRMSPAALSGSMSQPTPRFDHHTDMMTILQYASPSMAANMEGFIKGLHNKFQIPKLSQRPSGSSGSGGRTTPNPEPQTTTTTATSSLSQEQEQVNTDPGALAPTLTATPSGSSGSQRPTSGAAPSTDDLLLTQNTGGDAAGGDGVDEDLLASLAGE